MKQKNNIITTILLAVCISLPVSANSKNAFSQSSQLSILSPVIMIAGSVYMLTSMSSMIITSLEPLGESTIIVVEGISEGGKASAKLITSTAQEISLAVGDSLSVTNQKTGLLLKNKNDDLVAFIPNKQTQKNIYQHKRQWKSSL